MKILSNLLIGFMALGLIVSCQDAPEGEAAKTGEAAENTAKITEETKMYQVTSGNVDWAATKVGGAHNGTFQVTKGKIGVENGEVTSGKFVIDINSMTEETLEGEMHTKFLTHMKSADFFDVGNHPAGQFDIVSLEPLSGNAEASHNVTGNLKLRGITKSITFPANISVADDKITVGSSKFTINRTDWEMKYNAAIIGTAADKIIHDDVSLSIRLEAQGK